MDTSCSSSESISSSDRHPVVPMRIITPSRPHVLVTDQFPGSPAFKEDEMEEEYASSGEDSTKAVILPDSFQPTEYDVVSGRGKGYYARGGNERLRDVIRDFSLRYSRTTNKFEKGNILNEVVETVRKNGNGRFVKKSKGQWLQLSQDQAREKVGHIMRDVVKKMTPEELAAVAITPTKRTSKSKGAIRKVRLRMGKKKERVPSLVLSTAGSHSSSSTATYEEATDKPDRIGSATWWSVREKEASERDTVDADDPIPWEVNIFPDLDDDATTEQIRNESYV